MKYTLLTVALLGSLFGASQAQAQEFFHRGRNPGGFFGEQRQIESLERQALFDFSQAHNLEIQANRAFAMANNQQNAADAYFLAADRAAQNGNFAVAFRDERAADRAETLARIDYITARRDERRAHHDIVLARYDIREARYDERHDHFPAPPPPHHGGSPE